MIFTNWNPLLYLHYTINSTGIENKEYILTKGDHFRPNFQNCLLRNSRSLAGRISMKIERGKADTSISY